MNLKDALDNNWNISNVAKPEISDDTFFNKLKSSYFSRVVQVVDTNRIDPSMDLRQSYDESTMSWTLFVKSTTRSDLDDMVSEIARILTLPPSGFDYAKIESTTYTSDRFWKCEIVVTGKEAKNY